MEQPLKRSSEVQNSVCIHLVDGPNGYQALKYTPFVVYLKCLFEYNWW